LHPLIPLLIAYDLATIRANLKASWRNRFELPVSEATCGVFPEVDLRRSGIMAEGMHAP
jgi:hypothetical protein